MIELTLKDGSIRQAEAGQSAAEVIKGIGMGLYKAACCVKINGEVKDLRTVLTENCSFEVMTFDSIEGKKAFWHTASHILAQAVKRLYPEAKLAIGPAIDNGFYYDFDVEKPFTADELVKIEAEMKQIVKEGIPLEQFELPPAEALKKLEEMGEPYKVELCSEHAGKGEPISFYKQGDFTDLCAGPHLMTTAPVKAFKLLSCTGAYWRGSEKNKMLSRIYGTAYPKAAELEAYLKQLEEAKLRDHNKLGRELELFTTVDCIGQGLPILLPKGARVIQLLQRWVEDTEQERGYLLTKTPLMAKRELYKISGHWDHYRENMFPAMEMEGESYVLRPMNCPHHMMIYANRPHSYRDLPMRIGEIAHDFRYESSGTLKGIERGRHFCQNDAHLFCTPEQIKSEVADVCNLIFETYKDFNITDYRCVLSLRDPADKKKYHDDDAMWNHAENALRIHFTEEIGEAAFYGPKLDVNVKPAVGAEYTLSTCQLDFCLPAKFHLTYVDKDGSEKTPVVLHRAILGSLDRFMAYLIEETKGKFPTWLAPVQVKVLPVSEKTLEYSEAITEKLVEAGIRVALDDDNQKIGYKIREAQSQKIPYMLVLGDKEAENDTISVRTLSGEQSVESLADFIARRQAVVAPIFELGLDLRHDTAA